MSRGLYAACQNGLLEDHSGGYRIEPLRPGELRIENPVLRRPPLFLGEEASLEEFGQTL
jgi:hypothetical protein